MNGKAVAARREYQKQWRQKNRERIRQYMENYWARKAEEMAKQTDGDGALTVLVPDDVGDDHGGRAVDV